MPTRPACPLCISGDNGGISCLTRLSVFIADILIGGTFEGNGGQCVGNRDDVGQPMKYLFQPERQESNVFLLPAYRIPLHYFQRPTFRFHLDSLSLLPGWTFTKDTSGWTNNLTE
jgi:hypothetical protein